MKRTSVVVVGAGQSGLAMSSRLSDRSIDHVLLERGEVANSWKTERWDSLRLLTPNWQTRLPGLEYDGDDPDGFMSVSDVVEFIERHAKVVAAPVQGHTTVTRVGGDDDGYTVETSDGPWRADAVVLASGAYNRPRIPGVAADLPSSVHSVTPHDYRRPDDLPDGGVLVVGASATGTQLAEEIHRSGRPVTVAVGEHVRMPRRYRGFDIQRWLDATGRLDERYDEVDDIVRARRVPSPQLAGSDSAATLDLNSLTDAGVRLVGRLAAVGDTTVQFSGSLRNVCSLADLKMDRLLGIIDEWIDDNPDHHLSQACDDIHRFEPTRVDDDPDLSLPLGPHGISTVVWATGFEPDYSWLDLPLIDRRGRVRHDGGVVTGAPGLYLLGTNFLRRRKSTFIHGAADDTADLATHLAAHLDDVASPA